jgi:hypothetical protein
MLRFQKVVASSISGRASAIYPFRPWHASLGEHLLANDSPSARILNVPIHLQYLSQFKVYALEKHVVCEEM